MQKFMEKKKRIVRLQHDVVENITKPIDNHKNHNNLLFCLLHKKVFAKNLNIFLQFNVTWQAYIQL